MVGGPGPCVINVVPSGLPGGPEDSPPALDLPVPPPSNPQVITAPSDEMALSSNAVFLAGGITNCPEWQRDLIALVRERGFQGTLFNPRRGDFDVRDPNMEREQITWEYQRLRESSCISFWFPCETLCPITLFEYGKALGQGRKVRVGVHPDYGRRSDVEIQTELERGDGVEIVYSLPDLAEQIASL